jgi:SAM-dependent methyltransferase
LVSIMTACPLCGSKDSRKEEEINARHLNKLYNDFLGERIDELFIGHETVYKLRCQVCDLIFFYPSILGKDVFYSLLQRRIEYYPLEKDEYTYALRFISKDDHLLEIGCGTGEFGQKVDHYVGLDINEDALQTARKRGLNVLSQPLNEYARKNRGEYDIVCAFQVLEHAKSPKEFIQSCLTCLRESGKIIFSVPSADSFIIFVPNHLFNLPPHHQTWWTDRALTYVEKIFPVKLLDIYHEKVQDVHLESFIEVLYREILKKFLPCTKRTVTMNFTTWDKVIIRLSRYLNRKTKDIFCDGRFRPNGHTVTAVYQKEAS